MVKLNLLAAGDHIVVTWGTLCMDIITSSMISSHNGVYGNYIILKHGLDSMDWFLYDNGLRHERVNRWFYFDPLVVNFVWCCALFRGLCQRWRCYLFVEWIRTIHLNFRKIDGYQDPSKNILVIIENLSE